MSNVIEKLQAETGAYLRESWEHALMVLQSMSMHERAMHFNMQTWGERTKCGTVACLAGHCALDPWFVAQRGLRGRFRRSELIIGSGRWNGREQKFRVWRGTALDEIFGSDYSSLFFETGKDHDDMVREVMVLIAKLGGAPVSPLGFGIPAYWKEIPGFESAYYED